MEAKQAEFIRRAAARREQAQVEIAALPRFSALTCADDRKARAAAYSAIVDALDSDIDGLRAELGL